MYIYKYAIYVYTYTYVCYTHVIYLSIYMFLLKGSKKEYKFSFSQTPSELTFPCLSLKMQRLC